MKIQKIRDERLIIRNLKNIRIIYVLQALGILSILVYNFAAAGMDGIKENPLWIVFVASTIVLVFLSKGTDERLAFKNLQKIRIAFVVQTVGILGILGYDLVTLGMDGMRENPLWLIFIVAMTINAYLSMNISADHENDKKPAKKGLIISVIVVAVISITIGILTALSEGSTAKDGIIIGLVILICGLASSLFVFNLRRKKEVES